MTPPSIPLEEAPCPMGCAAPAAPVLRARDRLSPLPDLFAVVRCPSCGHLRTNPRPTLDGLREYYASDYFLHQEESADVHRSAEGGATGWRRLLRAATPIGATPVPSLRPGRLLELGCGTGRFLHGMARAGWDVEGIEFSAKAADVAAGLGYKVSTGSLETLPPPEKPFDVVAAWMVLEHLPDPIGALRILRSWTRPGGWLLLSVPNAASREFALFRDAWFALQVPSPLHHFTPHTLRGVLKRSGWRLAALRHQRLLTNVLRSLRYRFEERPALSRWGPWLTSPLLEKALFPIAALLAAFGQTGRMTAWARRGKDA